MRLIGTCFPDYIYPVKSDLSHSTTWKGFGVTWMMDIMQLMNISLAEVKIVTDLSPSNITNTLLQTVADDKADMVPVESGMTYSRYQIIDFTGPTGVAETMIFSKKQVTENNGNFLYKTFDQPSFIMVLISILSVSIAFWASQDGKKRHLSFGTCSFYTLGNCLAEGLPNVMKDKLNGSQKFILGVLGLVLVVLFKSFSGTVTASLLHNKSPKQIESLWDVAELSSLKIISANGTFWYEDLMNHAAADLLKDRVEVRPLFRSDPTDIENVLHELVAGTHVLIGYQDTLRNMLKITDQHFEHQFHSSQAMMSRSFGIGLTKKTSNYTRKISTGFYWLNAFGLLRKDHFEEFVQYHPEKRLSMGDRCKRPADEKVSENLVKKRRLQALRGGKKRVRLGLEHLQMTFFVYIVGLLLSLTVFIFENLKVKFK